MINSVVDGICVAIANEFGDEYRIYTESIKQGLKEPCFFIQHLESGSSIFRQNRYFRTNAFAIQFFPSSSNVQQDCADVKERLFACLDVVDSGDGLVRGSAMESTITDSVLTLTVSYDFFVDRETEINYMEEFKFNGGVKHGKN